MEVYIFDMDGTILDSMSYWNNLIKNFLKTLGIEIDEETNSKFLSMTIKDTVDFIKKEYRFDMSKESVLSEMDEMMSYNYQNLVKLEPSTYEIFDTLKRYDKKIVLATATPRNLADIPLKKFELSKYFDLEIVSDEVNLHKDDPRYFENIADYFGEDASDCVVIEDSLYAMKSAKKADMVTVAVTEQSIEEHLRDIFEISDVAGENLSSEVVKDFLKKSV